MTLSNDMTNANFPVDGEGRTYHVGLKCGEVSLIKTSGARAVDVSNMWLTGSRGFLNTSMHVMREYLRSLTSLLVQFILAHRVITVGDPERAGKFAKLLDQEDADLFAHLSHRGFYTITGTYKGVPVSIVAIGMTYHANSHDAHGDALVGTRDGVKTAMRQVGEQVGVLLVKELREFTGAFWVAH
ncbi:hypothetical protein BJ085DRAFT_40990, partial [Dimargaris cristalligena]